MRKDPSAHPHQNKPEGKPLLASCFYLLVQFAAFAVIVLVLLYQLSNQTHYQFFANNEYPLTEPVYSNFTHPLQTLKTMSVSYQSHNKDLATQLFDAGIFNEFYSKFKKSKHSVIMIHSSNKKQKPRKKSSKNKKNHELEADIEENASLVEKTQLLEIFLKHFALSEGYYMVEREYKPDFIGGIYSTARAVRNFFQKKMKLENEHEGEKILYILHLEAQNVPEQEIENLLKSQEEKKIVILSNRSLKIKKFKNLGYFPQINLKSQLSSALNTQPETIEIYMDYYGFAGIFDHLKIDAIEAQKHLGSNYVSIPSQSPKNKEIREMLNHLCESGQQKIFSTSKIKRNKSKLSKLGVMSYNSTLYWADDIFRLNYMLQEGNKCIPTPIDHLPEKILLRAWSVKSKILTRYEQKLIKEEQEQLRRLQEERINRRVQDLQQKLQQQENMKQEQKECECKCSINIEKECQIIFTQMRKAQKLEEKKLDKKKAQENSQNKENNIETSPKKRVRIGLKGFEKFVIGEKILTDGDMSLEQIENAIKHPKGRMKEVLQSAVSQQKEKILSNLNINQQQKDSQNISDEPQQEKKNEDVNKEIKEEEQENRNKEELKEEDIMQEQDKDQSLDETVVTDSKNDEEEDGEQQQVEKENESMNTESIQEQPQRLSQALANKQVEEHDNQTIRIDTEQKKQQQKVEDEKTEDALNQKQIHSAQIQSQKQIRNNDAQSSQKPSESQPQIKTNEQIPTEISSDQFPSQTQQFSE